MCAEKITSIVFSKEPSLAIVKKKTLSWFGQVTRHPGGQTPPWRSQEEFDEFYVGMNSPGALLHSY